MKYLSLLLFLFFIGVNGGYAQTVRNAENSILWEISGKGLEHKSYLLGTFHGDDSVKIDYQYIDSLPRFHEVMNDVDAVGMEFDFGDSVFAKLVGEKMVKCITGRYPAYAYLPDSIRSFESLFEDSAKYRYVEQFLSDFKHRKYVRPFRHERLKPAYIYTLIESWKDISKQLKAHKEGEKPAAVIMDAGIYQLAKEKGKRIIGLSTAEYEFNLNEVADSCTVMSGSMTKQANDLYICCRIERGDSVVSYINDMIELYRQEDLSKMYSESKKMERRLKDENQEMEFMDDFFKELVLVRNSKWLKKIVENVQVCPCLIAVGALHLPGEEGLISMLRKEGYTIRPVNIRSKDAY